jgi:carbonic anhydrase
MQVRLLFILFVFAAAAFGDEECPPRYSYCGYSGPAQWPNLPIANNQCGGERQSPINMVPEKPTLGEAINVNYIAGHATIRNTGHDILVTPTDDAGGKITIGRNVYQLLQLHFHVPSEHQLNGTGAPAEMHIVHRLVGGGADDYAVIGVMLSSGTTYEALEPVFANLPEKVCDTKFDPLWIEFDKLLPKKVSSYYTYAGSLTTPPCTQSVIWYVLGEGRTISVSELRKLGALGENARAIQRKMNVTFVRSQ